MDFEPTLLFKKRSLIDRLFMYFEKRSVSDSLFLKICILAVAVSAVWLVIEWSRDASVEISTSGGTLIEGVVGTPRFINPVLAVTRADKDMSALIYAGLMRLGDGGSLVPDVAESITVSDDGLTYDVVLKQNVYFHDDTQLTAADVVFTIGHIQNPALTSPHRASFSGVTIEELGEFELNIVLTEPYAPFIENLTVGILPRHIWKDATNEEFPFSQHNSEPIGAGPYKVKRIDRNTSGIPESYVLEPHTAYHHTVPKIAELKITFFPNEALLVNAFNTKMIDSVAGLSAESFDMLTLEDSSHEILTIPLPRTFALFFNQNKSAVLRDISARKALDAVIPRAELIDTVLKGYGRPLHSPIPEGFGIDTTTYEPTDSSSTPLDTARDILKKGGWTFNSDENEWTKEVDKVSIPLAVTISTANNPVFESTAEFLRQKWEQLGVHVTVKQFEQSDLTQGIIRPRDYEALLFGTDLGRSLDFYSFWHSSQRNDPGLNVSLYANLTTDSILTEARTNASSTVRTESFIRFSDELLTETPAIFLYSPELMYVFPTAVNGKRFTGLSEPHERFSNIEEWSVETESVWPIFQE